MKHQSKLTRELAIVKVTADGSHQDEALNVVGAWSGRLLELSPTHFTAELTAEPEKLSHFLEALSAIGAISAIRSGPLGLLE